MIRRSLSCYIETIARLARAEGGNVLILTALAMPVVVSLMLGGGTVMMTMAKKAELTDIAETACNRGLKPTRTGMYEDADRKRMAELLLASLATKHHFTITSRTVTQGFLEGSVTANATIPSPVPLDIMGDAIPISVTATCKGVPPYPKKQAVILSSQFSRPTATPLLATYQDWAVFKPQDYGWDGGTGPGVEIQDWIKNPGYGALPPGAVNGYVVELDSDAGGKKIPTNSSMRKRVELHRGTYEFSFWYFGRVADTNSNRISVYLTGIRPVSAMVQKLTIAEPRSKGWIFAKFEVPVSVYSVYDLTVAAEGTDDTFGGNFNSLQLKYIKRPSDKYSD